MGPEMPDRRGGLAPDMVERDPVFGERKVEMDGYWRATLATSL